MREIYDVITKETILIERGKLKLISRQLEIDYTAVCHIFKKDGLHIKHRFILPKNKDKIFTLIDLDSKKEYDCISSSTLGIHLNTKLTNNEIKYLGALRDRKQTFASIQNKVFYLKGVNPIIKNTGNIKSFSIEMIKKQKQFKINEKLKKRLNCRIRHALERYHIRKLNKTEELLGCKTIFFIGYLEAQFKKNMTWDNYGKLWHIDHIVPCGRFDLNNIDEQYKCFHYTNLRPLWKSTKIAREQGDDLSIGNYNRLKVNIDNRELSPDIKDKIWLSL